MAFHFNIPHALRRLTVFSCKHKLPSPSGKSLKALKHDPKAEKLFSGISTGGAVLNWNWWSWCDGRKKLKDIKMKHVISTAELIRHFLPLSAVPGCSTSRLNNAVVNEQRILVIRDLNSGMSTCECSNFACLTILSLQHYKLKIFYRKFKHYMITTETVKCNWWI